MHLRWVAMLYSIQRSGEYQLVLAGWLWPHVYVPAILSFLICILINSADCLLHFNSPSIALLRKYDSILDSRNIPAPAITLSDYDQQD